MPGATRLENLTGVPIGQLGDSRQPILEDLRRRGIQIDTTTVNHLRIGRTSGELIAERVEADQALRQNNAFLRDSFFLKLANAGILFYRGPQSGANSSLYSTLNLSTQLSEFMGIDSSAIRSCVRGARVDMSEEAERRPGDPFVEVFDATAREFLDGYTRSIYPNPAVDYVRANWRGSVIDFYRTFYRAPGGGTAIKAWSPYELDVLKAYYEGRYAIGNILTPFDKRILQAKVDMEPSDDVAVEIDGEMGFPVDDQTISTYRELLLQGSPRRNGRSSRAELLRDR